MRHLKLFIFMAVAFALMVPAAVMARGIDPVVSTEWLDKNLADQKLVIVDIRKVEEYQAGHVPGAINIFYNIWAPGKDDMQNELPADDDLKDTLSANGIAADSRVVVVGKTDTPPDKVNVTRVALTLIYAGVNDVAVLDGGFNKWTAEAKKVSTDAVKPKEKAYKGKFNKGLFIKKEDVAAKIGKAVILDTREPAFYGGEKKLDFVAKPGHVKGAVNLPTMSLIFNADNTYKPVADLQAAAIKAAGEDKAKEIIVYCDSGRVASAWWYLLREVLGYTDIKIYDGSFQDWAKDANLPVEP
jgi:thiosulfate/3-mercaptopyruvate sulfurtransferase